MTYSRTVTKGTIKITEKGDLFDRARTQGILNKAIAQGTKKLLPRVVSTVTDKMDSSFKKPTGAMKRSVKSKLYESGVGVVNSDIKEPRRTWAERGTRGGVKLTKGSNAFAAGKRYVRAERKEGYYRDEIARALND
jgi:hypothetical protein